MGAIVKGNAMQAKLSLRLSGDASVWNPWTAPVRNRCPAGPGCVCVPTYTYTYTNPGFIYTFYYY